MGAGGRSCNWGFKKAFAMVMLQVGAVVGIAGIRDFRQRIIMVTLQAGMLVGVAQMGT